MIYFNKTEKSIKDVPKGQDMTDTQQQNRRILREISIDCIIPNTMQPRKIFDERELIELSENIKQIGLIQPLTVKYYGDGLFELVAGERRLRACIIAKMQTVPCVILDIDAGKSAVMALAENLQRKDLNCFEQAHAIAILAERFSLTQSEIAKKLGKSQPSIANKLRLLKIPVSLQQKIIAAGLSERHARALLRLPQKDMEKALEVALKQRMTVDTFEKYTDQLLKPIKLQMKPKMKGICRDIRLYLNTINQTLGLMRSSGFKTQTEKEEFEDRLVYKITIRK